jgi:hypothetical protein
MKQINESIQKISRDIRSISESMQQLRKSQLEKFNEAWISGHDVIKSLNISLRTLQSLRDSGLLPFSRINGKFFYKVSDLEKLMEENYTPSKSNSHETR